MPGDKSEQPTPRRIQQARREGRFVISREFAGALEFTAAVALLAWMGGVWIAEARDGLRAMLRSAFAEGGFGRNQAVRVARDAILALAPAGALLGFALLAVGTGAQLAVSGMGLSLARLAPDLKRLDPLRRLRELPRQNLPALVQAAALLPLFGLAVYAVIRENLGTWLRLPLMGIEAGAGELARSVEGLLWRAAGLFLALGCIDFYRQHRRYRKDLRMSRQDIRDEMKEVEGNPQVKMRIRRLQRDLLRRRMMAEVPKATAVVVNPTHFAVALRYRPKQMAAPLVVAKGKNFLAARIRARAVEHEVPIIENPPLAQALYKSVEVGQEIPAHLYQAVAEILAYIFRVMGGRLPG